jgi:hypothetical protein
LVEPVIDIQTILINPLGPNSALNAEAVTTVGRIKGIVNSALSIFFPGKVNREKIHAEEIQLAYSH